MSLTTTGSNALAVSGGNPFLDAADDMGAKSGALFLKYDGNTGRFSFGKDQEELEKGRRFAINPAEFRNGYICWNDGKVEEEIMVRVVDGKPPAKGSLTDHGPYADDEKDGWREQSSVEFRDVESGDQFLFKTSSKGGRIAVGNLVRDYGKAFSAHPGELAVVELGSVSFDAKDGKGRKLGKKYAPMFKIVGWQDEAELVARLEAQASDEDEAPEPEMPVNTGGRRNRNF